MNAAQSRDLCRKGFPANPAPIPRPRLTGEARLLRTEGHLGQSGAVAASQLGDLTPPPQSPPGPVSGRPRPATRGREAGRVAPHNPALRTPPQGRPLGAHFLGYHSWAVRPGTSGTELRPPVCGVASHRPGTGHPDRFVLFGAESVPVFCALRKEWGWNSCVDGAFCSGPLELLQGAGTHFQVVPSARWPGSLLRLPLPARTAVLARA